MKDIEEARYIQKTKKPPLDPWGGRLKTILIATLFTSFLFQSLRINLKGRSTLKTL